MVESAFETPPGEGPKCRAPQVNEIGPEAFKETDAAHPEKAMKLYGLDPALMLVLLDAYVKDRDLRPRLAKEPRLAPFIEDLERLASDIGAALETRKQPNKRAKAALKKEIEALDAALATLIRQTWFLLQTARHTDDPKTVAAAERLELVLLPEGRSIVRGTAMREAAAASQADIRLRPQDRAWMENLRGPGGSLAELHERRMALAKAFFKKAEQLRVAEIYETKPVSLVPVRREFARVLRSFVHTLDYLQLRPADRSFLLRPFGWVLKTKNTGKKKVRSPMRAPETSQAEGQEKKIPLPMRSKGRSGSGPRTSPSSFVSAGTRDAETVDCRTDRLVLPPVESVDLEDGPSFVDERQIAFDLKQLLTTPRELRVDEASPSETL